MDVHFISKQKGNTVIQCPELGPKHVIRFVRGRCTTSNKTEIRRILSDDYARRNTKLRPGQDLEKISEYLDSPDNPDVFTKEYLNAIPFKLWEQILEETERIDVQFPLVGIAKAALEGQPIDPVIERIVSENAGITLTDGGVVETEEEEETEDDEPVKAKTDPNDNTNPERPARLGKIKLPNKAKETEEEAKSSNDHTVREAIAYLGGKEHDEVADYLEPDEDRVSLIRYWNERYPDYAVDLPE